MSGDRPPTAWETKTLQDVVRWNGGYMAEWRPKTLRKLERMGLIHIALAEDSGEEVAMISDFGREFLATLA